MSDTIRNYRNTVQLHFDKRGENFTLKVPHHSKWIAIIKFLKQRGWTITENPSYEENYKCLSKYHKLGFKKDMACLMEIGNNFIRIEFGNEKNLWKGIAQSFWSSPTDNRTTKLSYQESTRVKLEIKKTLEFCKKYNLEFEKEDSDLNPEEYIIHSLKNNTHIHGQVNCLEDIKLSMKEDSYDYLRNSNDKNDKKIICGDKKYFYDYYTKRLCCGIAWHHINNMWWIISNNQLHNIACFRLFDYEPNLPRREKIEMNENKIDNLLKYYEEKKDYLRCHIILKHFDKKNNKKLEIAA